LLNPHNYKNKLDSSKVNFRVLRFGASRDRCAIQKVQRLTFHVYTKEVACRPSGASRDPDPASGNLPQRRETSHGVARGDRPAESRDRFARGVHS
jgi:hypothetical protein